MCLRRATIFPYIPDILHFQQRVHHISILAPVDHLRFGCRQDLNPFISSGKFFPAIFQTATSGFPSGAA
jgi:hypothetical protein